MHTIKKQFDFCYGHRVWSQTLNPTFSEDSCLKCRHLHGHQGTIIISLQSAELVRGMVTDFKHMNWFKTWLDNTLDHKFLMDIKDPLMLTFFGDIQPVIKYFPEKYWIFDSKYLEGRETHIIEYLEGMVFVNFVPTSENISKWIFEIVTEKMKPLEIQVESVQFFETPKSQSIYTNL